MLQSASGWPDRPLALEPGSLAVCGTADPYLPAEDLAALEATGAGVLRYPGADHAFVHDPARPEHRPNEAADAWRRVTDFLR